MEKQKFDAEAAKYVAEAIAEPLLKGGKITEEMAAEFVAVLSASPVVAEVLNINCLLIDGVSCICHVRPLPLKDAPNDWGLYFDELPKGRK